MWFTLLIPETKGKSLEELNGEDVLPQLSYGGAVAAAAAEVALVPATQQAADTPAEQGAPPPLGARRA